MQHPTSTAVRKMIDKFKSVLPLAQRENHLSMSCTSVKSINHPCGSIHCHGGWYAIASNLHLSDALYIPYTKGVEQMDRDLGFKATDVVFSSDSGTVQWARNNPSIWGNYNGIYMFSRKDAFVSPTRPEGANTLADIIHHWEEVAERLESLEREVEISEPPITAEALIDQLEPGKANITTKYEEDRAHCMPIIADSR